MFYFRKTKSKILTTIAMGTNLHPNDNTLWAITNILLCVANDLTFDDLLGKFTNSGSNTISMSREIYDSIRSYIDVPKKDKKIAIVVRFRVT